jgi:hypothetical protein
MDAAILNRAESPRRKSHATNPYSALVILKERENIQAGKPRILGKLSTLPTGKSLRGGNPESSITSGQQVVNYARREMLTSWRLPLHVPHTIEAKQAEIGAQPEVAVGCLSN